MKSVELLGFLLIANAIAVAAWWLLANRPNVPYALALCSLVVFVGLALVFYERVSEITIARVGSIKTAAQQAVGDAEEIAALKKRIEGQAATVDLVARKATDAETLSKELSKKNELADKKLTEIESILKRAEKNLADLDALSLFTGTVIAAQNDDRRAFEQLEKWANDTTSPYSARAGQVYGMILDASAKLIRTAYDMPKIEGVNFEKDSLDAMIDAFKRARWNDDKRATLQAIQRREDVPAKDKLTFYAKLLHEEPSLTVAEEAGVAFTGAVGLKIKPLALTFLNNWWEQHKDKNFDELKKQAEQTNAEIH